MIDISCAKIGPASKNFNDARAPYARWRLCLVLERPNHYNRKLSLFCAHAGKPALESIISLNSALEWPGCPHAALSVSFVNDTCHAGCQVPNGFSFEVRIHRSAINRIIW